MYMLNICMYMYICSCFTKKNLLYVETQNINTYLIDINFNVINLQHHYIENEIINNSYHNSEFLSVLGYVSLSVIVFMLYSINQ